MQVPLVDELTSENQLKDFLKDSFYKRYLSASKLDVDSWLVLWRNILLANFGTGKTPFLAEKGNLGKIVNYVRLLSKASVLQKKYASRRLLKTLILLETPLDVLKES